MSQRAHDKFLPSQACWIEATMAINTFQWIHIHDQWVIFVAGTLTTHFCSVRPKLKGEKASWKYHWFYWSLWAGVKRCWIHRINVSIEFRRPLAPCKFLERLDADPFPWRWLRNRTWRKQTECICNILTMSRSASLNFAKLLELHPLNGGLIEELVLVTFAIPVKFHKRWMGFFLLPPELLDHGLEALLSDFPTLPEFMVLILEPLLLEFIQLWLIMGTFATALNPADGHDGVIWNTGQEGSHPK